LRENPSGNIVALSTLTRGAFPLGLDVEYGFTSALHAGVFGELTAVPLRNFSGYGWAYQLGAKAEYSFAPKEAVEPWLGLATSYEQLTFPEGTTRHAKGWLYFTAQLGVDWRLGGVSVGPFTSFALGKYSHEAGGLGELAHPVLHERLVFGVRGYFDFGER
jgi:hypothetical protein